MPEPIKLDWKYAFGLQAGGYSIRKHKAVCGPYTAYYEAKTRVKDGMIIGKTRLVYYIGGFKDNFKTPGDLKDALQKLIDSNK